MTINAQDNDSSIIGYWKIQKMQIANELVFDVHDTTIMAEALYKKAQRNNKTLTKSDSLQVNEKIALLFPIMAKTFFQFKSDGAFICGVCIENSSGYQHTIRQGHYMLYGNRVRIDSSIEGTDSMTEDFHFATLVQKNVLFLMKDGWENTYYSYVRYRD